MAVFKPKFSSVELFERFKPRFHEITLVAYRFDHSYLGHGKSLEEATRENYDKTRTFLVCGRHKGGGYAPGASMDINGMGVDAVTFELDPGNPIHPFVQLERAIAEAVNERVLKNRRFFLHEKWRDPCSSKRLSNDQHLATITSEGGEIHGLRLPLETRTFWEAFIPSGAERTAIEKTKEIDGLLSDFNSSMRWLNTTEDRYTQQRERVKKSMVEKGIETERQLEQLVENLKNQLDEALALAG